MKLTDILDSSEIKDFENSNEVIKTSELKFLCILVAHILILFI